MIYAYFCEHCNRGLERICSLASYVADEGYLCPHCGAQTKQIICAPIVLGKSGEFQAFKSVVDGSLISSRRDLAEHNKRNNVVNLHDGYDEAAVQKMTKKDYQKPLDEERAKDLNKDIEKAIAQCTDGYMPQLAREVIPP
jgi:predicted nucleic acid-binding Zn ribbon protein